MVKTTNAKEILVLKRNGEKEPLDVEKIHKVVEFACNGISGVSVSDVVMAAHLTFYNGISSREIHQTIIKSAADLITEKTPNYQYVAGRLLSYEMRKLAWGGLTPPRLFDHITKMIEEGYYSEDLLELYTEDEWDRIEKYMNHDRDLEMVHIGVAEYLTKYAVRDRSAKDIIPLETQQYTYILVAALMMNGTKNFQELRSFYNQISTFEISLPTPIMAGLRTPTKQYSSCVLIEIDDTLDSIIAGTGAIVKYISKKAGIGICASGIRGEGSPVAGNTIKHTGVIPFYRMFESAVKSCSQGGVRGGSATLYTMLWHSEIEDILALKDNKGTQDTRVRKIDYGIQINNYLYKRIMDGKDITLFSPSDTPGLLDAFFGDQQKFAELYEKYERSRVKKKKIPARDLYYKLVMQRKDTGRIYIFNVDNTNNHSPFKEPVKMSNLCAEITLLTKPLKHLYDEEGRIALCTLAAVNMGKIKELSELEAIMRSAVVGLDNLLDYQDYPVPAAKQATLDYRPLGIGVINMAYYLAKNDARYGDETCLALVDEFFEAMQFYGLKASMELAKIKGPCREFAKTKYAEGLLPIDHYNKNVDKIIPHKTRLDWEWLRGEIMQHGLRNACITAFMPSESSSKISGSTSGVDPIRSLVTYKPNKANSSSQVVPEMVRLKNKYDRLWDMTSMDGLIKTMAVTQKHTDQSISTNLSYNPAHYENGEIPMSVLTKDILKANMFGLKTLYYHNTNDQRGNGLIDVADKELQDTLPDLDEEEVCSSCVI